MQYIEFFLSNNFTHPTLRVSSRQIFAQYQKLTYETRFGTSEKFQTRCAIDIDVLAASIANVHEF